MEVSRLTPQCCPVRKGKKVLSKNPELRTQTCNRTIKYEKIDEEKDEYASVITMITNDTIFIASKWHVHTGREEELHKKSHSKMI